MENELTTVSDEIEDLIEPVSKEANVLAEAPKMPVIDNQSPLITMIERIACNPDADMDKLERLLVMQKEVMADEAEKSYLRALSKAQGEFPAIEKNGKIIRKRKGTEIVIGETEYSKYEDIMSECRPVLAAHGLSIQVVPLTDYTKQMGGARLTIAHECGHSISEDLMVPFDLVGKNAAQAVGSSQSYAKRYLLKGRLNIIDKSDTSDDDGVSSGPDETDRISGQRDRLVRMGIAIRKNIHSIAYVTDMLKGKNWLEAYEGYNEISPEDRNSLFVSETKGGPFSKLDKDILHHEIRTLANVAD